MKNVREVIESHYSQFCDEVDPVSLSSRLNSLISNDRVRVSLGTTRPIIHDHSPTIHPSFFSLLIYDRVDLSVSYLIVGL